MDGTQKLVITSIVLAVVGLVLLFSVGGAIAGFPLLVIALVLGTVAARKTQHEGTNEGK